MRTLVHFPVVVALSPVAGGGPRAEACASWSMIDVEKLGDRCW
jgi:hypothetical protein